MLDSCQNEFILYLWRNDKTVFIGKNQNAYTECRMGALISDGGFLARRFTGGGAVYHDKGNLNFTFIVPREEYDLANQFGILEAAMRSLGLNVSLSGRNDVLIDGKKFSGNAFYRGERNCLHHGTILIDSDYDAIAKYLNVSRVKLNAKGVKSVKSRVCNLREYRSDLNADMVADALRAALRARYPLLEARNLSERELPQGRLAELKGHFSDESYILGDNVLYDISFESRYEWGVADVRLKMNGSVIERARIYSDALDTEAISQKERILIGLDLKKEPDERVKDILETLGAERDEI